MAKMKRILIISLLAFAACNNTNSNNSPAANQLPTALVNNPHTANGLDIVAADRKPVMAFKDTLHDFGAINENEKVACEFAFTNTGKTPLIISNATGSCGCTVPDYPHEPVAPGKSGIMKVTFNSAGKKGRQEKSVTIHTNSIQGIHMLYITADIKPANN
jgi:hypothetical protein